MKIDYDVGDVVVCVESTNLPASNPLPPMRRGEIGRVAWIGESYDRVAKRDDLGVALEGRNDGLWAYHARCFRKLPRADDTFTEQMRALRPHKVEEPA